MSTEALLIMDAQNGIVDRLGDHPDMLLDTLARTADAARAAGIAVIYVRVAFRPGGPEMSSRNQVFARLAGTDTMSESEPGTQIHAAIAPHAGDVVVTKRRVSAFTGSDLEVVLRAANVDSLVLTGIATSGVVLSTLRQAADMDFKLTILRDACADGDPETHRILMEKVFPRQATVTNSAEWIELVGNEPS